MEVSDSEDIKGRTVTTRTTETTVTFTHPFTLSFLDGPQPAGTYRLVTDEAELPGITFLAFGRTSTMLHLPAIGTGGVHQVFTVDFAELEAAQEADARR